MSDIVDMYELIDTMLIDEDGILLNQIKYLFVSIIDIEKYFTEHNISGDVVECGNYKGVMLAFMTKVFPDRIIFGYDSQEGIPTDSKYLEIKYTSPENKMVETEDMWRGQYKGTALDINNTFTRYGISTKNLRLVKGWLKDTLPVSEVQDIALLRVDVDLYSSTYEALKYLYPKVVKGGCIILDDACITHSFHAAEDYFNSIGVNPILFYDYVNNVANPKRFFDYTTYAQGMCLIKE